MLKNLSLPKALIALALSALLLGAGGSLAADLARTTMKVDNLYCGSCLTHIDATLKSMAGVRGMRGDLAQGLVEVDHQSSLPSAKIAAAIAELGYPAKILSQKQITAQEAFASQPLRGSAASCCGIGNRGYTCSGSVTQRYGCSASAAAWKKLLRPRTTE